MSLPEIKSLIMNSYNRNKEPDLFVSGMKYTAVVDVNGMCTDVIIRDYQGNPFDPLKKYTVGMNSYIAATYKFDHTDPGATNFDTTAQTLINFLKEVNSVKYEGTRRIEIQKP
jgi:hypothetical protein